MTCGTMHFNGPAYPRDNDGCRLPVGHPGPHEFVAEDGQVFQWETDWDCTCEDCMSGDGDFCTTYWEKP